METVGILAGGLGLFLLAVGMITDGLKLAAGHMLRDLLGSWTRSPARGIVTGLSITAIVQSSSAITVATIGFVNAGLITMYQALGIVYGANIGTTVTGWLVAIIGFKIKVETFALPMIGLGMLLRLTGGSSRRAPLGIALAGFGLFFIGIDVLREGFEGLTATIDLQRFTAEGISGILSYVGIGFLMTTLTQSSSAAIAIILTAATGNIVGLHAAAAAVIGANVGTTSTAAFAVIGATPNAKRVAAAHVIFNAVTGAVALLSLPLLFLLIRSTGKIIGLQDIPAVTLALFHTTFNILGVALMWPISAKLTRFLERRFVTQEETEARPQFLDRTVLVSPSLALDALSLELSRIAAITRRMALAALSSDKQTGERLARDHDVVVKLANAAAEFIGLMRREALTVEVSEQMARLLNGEKHLLACADEALEIAREQSSVTAPEDPESARLEGSYRRQVAELTRCCDVARTGFSLAECEAQLARVEVTYDDNKAALLKAGAELRTTVPGVIANLEQNSRIRHMARQMTKSLQSLYEPYVLAGVIVPDEQVSEAD